MCPGRSMDRLSCSWLSIASLSSSGALSTQNRDDVVRRSKRSAQTVAMGHAIATGRALSLSDNCDQSALQQRRRNLTLHFVAHIFAVEEPQRKEPPDNTSGSVSILSTSHRCVGEYNAFAIRQPLAAASLERDTRVRQRPTGEQARRQPSDRSHVRQRRPVLP